MKDEMLNRILSMKIGEYSHIPYVNDFNCPDCGKTGEGYIHIPGGYVEKPKPILIGWCETPNGFMKVYECPECFAKFRYHGTTTARNFMDKFFDDVELELMLQDYRQKEQ